MKNLFINLYDYFIKVAIKYKDGVNNSILVLFILLVLYFTNWFEFYYWLIGFPSDVILLLDKIYDLAIEFLFKFYDDMVTYPTNLQIISIGVIKRFIIEDLIIPLLISNYWKIVKTEEILYFRLKYREFKKIPVLIIGPIIAPIVIFLSYFKVLGIIWYWVEKTFANKLFSKIKLLFLQWLPAAWIFLMDLPIISLIIEYTFLAKIISYFKGIEIPYVTKPISRLFKYFDKKIRETQAFFDKFIGQWLKKKAIARKFRTRKRINYILKKNIHDYHVLSKGYDYPRYKLKLERLGNWKLLRKEKKVSIKKLRRKILKQRVKKIPGKLKEKLGIFGK